MRKKPTSTQKHPSIKEMKKAVQKLYSPSVKQRGNQVENIFVNQGANSPSIRVQPIDIGFKYNFKNKESTIQCNLDDDLAF